jgi:hypothetical protein
MIFFALDIAPPYLDQAVLVWCKFFGLLPFVIHSFKNQKREKSRWFILIQSLLIVAFFYYYSLYRLSVKRIDEFWASISGSEDLIHDPYTSGFIVFYDFAIFAVPLSILSFLIGSFVIWCWKFRKSRNEKYYA